MNQHTRIDQINDLNRTCHVALVDDHALFLEGFASLLSRMNHIEVTGMYQSAEALLKNHNLELTDIVFMDAFLTGMQGDEATKEIRKRYSHIKVIALSHCKDGITVKKMIDAGVNGYITKDQTSKCVAEIIYAMERGESYLPPEIKLNIAYQLEEIDLNLSNRNLEVIRLMSLGKRNKEMSKSLNLSERTIEQEKSKIFRKMGVRNSHEAVAMAYKMKILF